jgi:hypothetical protein
MGYLRGRLLDRKSFVPAEISTPREKRKTYVPEDPEARRKRLEKSLPKRLARRIKRGKKPPPSLQGIRRVPNFVKARILDAVVLGYHGKALCKKAGIGWVRFYKLLRLDPDFAKQYAQAKRDALEIMESEIIEIADDVSQDRKKNGRVNKEHINRARLRIDTRKWVMKVRSPQKYGDKMLNEFGDAPAKVQFTMKFDTAAMRAEEGDVIEGEIVDETEGP